MIDRHLHRKYAESTSTQDFGCIPSGDWHRITEMPGKSKGKRKGIRNNHLVASVTRRIGSGEEVAPRLKNGFPEKRTLAAIIDWGQAGWYPAYWEYFKARRVRVDPEYFDDALQEEWYIKHLPMILDPVDDEKYYHPWLWFVLSKFIFGERGERGENGRVRIMVLKARVEAHRA